jgi:hypothetical protein
MTGIRIQLRSLRQRLAWVYRRLLSRKRLQLNVRVFDVHFSDVEVIDEGRLRVVRILTTVVTPCDSNLESATRDALRAVSPSDFIQAGRYRFMTKPAVSKVSESVPRSSYVLIRIEPCSLGPPSRNEEGPLQ